MNILPHIGLFGDLSACEDGLIQALNRNFLISDAVIQMLAKDFITVLPVDPEQGDVYILETDYYGTTQSQVIIYSGSNWIYLDPKLGWLSYVESQDKFFFYNSSGEWQAWDTTSGDVYGPNSSVAGNIVIFGDNTGKNIIDSGASLDDINDSIADVVSMFTLAIEDLQDQIDNLDLLPPQAGNAGKFLSTNGTVASWEEIQAGVRVSATQTLANAATAVIENYRTQRIKVKSNALESTILLPNGNVDGDVLYILGMDSSAVVIILNTGNVLLNGDITLFNGVQYQLIWEQSTTKWIEVGRP